MEAAAASTKPPRTGSPTASTSPCAQAGWTGYGLAGRPSPSGPGLAPAARQTAATARAPAQATGRQRGEGERPVGNSRGRNTTVRATVTNQSQVPPGQATAAAAGRVPGWAAA
jgi:hypothetical protein